MSKDRKPSLSSEKKFGRIGMSSRKAFQPEIAAEERGGRSRGRDRNELGGHAWRERAGAGAVYLQYCPPNFLSRSAR